MSTNLLKTGGLLDWLDSLYMTYSERVFYQTIEGQLKLVIWNAYESIIIIQQ